MSCQAWLILSCIEMPLLINTGGSLVVLTSLFHMVFTCKFQSAHLWLHLYRLRSDLFLKI